jgi:hypothetical protein
VDPFDAVRARSLTGFLNVSADSSHASGSSGKRRPGIKKIHDLFNQLFWPLFSDLPAPPPLFSPPGHSGIALLREAAVPAAVPDQLNQQLVQGPGKTISDVLAQLYTTRKEGLSITEADAIRARLARTVVKAHALVAAPVNYKRRSTNLLTVLAVVSCSERHQATIVVGNIR